MKNKEKKYHGLTVVFMVLYIVYVVCLFLLHPFVASAAETDSAEKKIPGGKGNVVSFESTRRNDKNVNSSAATFTAKEDFEIVAVIVEMGVGLFEEDKPSCYMLDFKQINGKGQLSSLSKGGLDDCTGFRAIYIDGSLQNSSAYTMDSFPSGCDYRNCTIPDTTITCTVSGCKIFKDSDALEAYVENGSLDGMIRDEVDRNWYLKDIRCKYNLNGSLSLEADADVATLDFTWLTDNLQDGDLLEVKTHNYVTKLNGDKISGFYDVVTWENNISAYEGKYSLLRYAASNAWLNTLENKPLLPKDFDTDVYYLRPYRNGKVGLWCKLTMGRSPNGDPYIVKREIGDLDDEGNWDRDDDKTDENGGDHGIDKDGNDIDPDIGDPFNGSGLIGIFKSFFDFMKSLPSLLGDLPDLVKTIIGFLPSWLIGFISIALVVVIILRLLGR